MREADRPLSLRVSVLDREPTESDVLPEHFWVGAMMRDVDVASVRLAFSDGDHRVYVGIAGPGDSLLLWSDSAFGRGGSIGPRETLVTHGARVQGSATMRGEVSKVVGIVSDEVIAVRVGATEAILINNIFVATGARFGDPIVVTTAEGERAVRQPRLPPGNA